MKDTLRESAQKKAAEISSTLRLERGTGRQVRLVAGSFRRVDQITQFGAVVASQRYVKSRSYNETGTFAQK